MSKGGVNKVGSLPQVINKGGVNKVVQHFGANFLTMFLNLLKPQFFPYSLFISYSCPIQFFFISYSFLIHVLFKSYIFISYSNLIDFLFNSYSFPIHFLFISFSFSLISFHFL